MKNEKGFTLIELVIVIAILGIIAAIALPKIVNFKEDAKLETLKANTHTLEQYVYYLAILEQQLDFDYVRSQGDGNDSGYDDHLSRRVELDLEKIRNGEPDETKKYLNNDGYANLHSGHRNIMNYNVTGVLNNESYRNPAVYITEPAGMPGNNDNLRGSIVVLFPDGESVEIFYVDFDGNESPRKVITR